MPPACLPSCVSPYFEFVIHTVACMSMQRLKANYLVLGLVIPNVINVCPQESCVLELKGNVVQSYIRPLKEKKTALTMIGVKAFAYNLYETTILSKYGEY